MGRMASRSLRWGVCCLGVGFLLSLVMFQRGLAAPGGPKKPGGPGPGGPRKAPRGGPPGPPRGLPGKAKPPRYYKPYAWHAERRYWHPTYVVGAPRYVYTSTGYPYYIGGTNYTVIEVPSAGETIGGEAAGGPSDVGEEGVRFSQIQELTEMIHEWRTLNESSEFQARVAAATKDDSPESKALLTKVKDNNTEFDRVSRAAMERLAASKSADGELERAGSALTRLMEVAEKLPAPTGER